ARRLEDRDHRRHRVRAGRLQGRPGRREGPRPDRTRPGRVGPPEVRGRCAPRAAGARHRVAGPHPHLRGGRPGHARGGGGRRRDQPQRPARRRLPLLRARRAVREHHRLRRADHAHPDRSRRLLPEREEPAAEQGAGPAYPALQAARHGPGGSRAGGRRRPPQPGPHRRPLREDPDLQLPGEPHLGPPCRLQGVQPGPGPGRRPRRGDPGLRRRGLGRQAGRRVSPVPTSGGPVNLLLAEVAQATQRLADAGVPSPRTDAEELAASVHGAKRGELHTVPDSDFDARYWEVIARREAREPLQHITGHAYFRYLELQVGPGVFVPRPETESVVGWAIDAVRAMDVVEPCIVDLCTGSGAIALALAQEVPRSRVHAVELSEDALRWTRRNMEGSRVDLRQGDALTAFPDLDGQVDLVISNPPYIPLTEWEYVAPEARDYDPGLALFSGED